MIRPLGDRVVVRIQEVAKKTAGGIELLQDSDPSAPGKGEVLAVGPGNYNDAGIREALEISVGDIVAFQKESGVLTEPGILVMHEPEIIAVIG